MKIWVLRQALLNKLNLSIFHGYIFNRGLDEDDKKEGLFKRLKNIENAQKNLINSNDGESIYYTPRSQFDSEHDKDEDQKRKKRKEKTTTT